MKILQLCKKFPYPLKDGESIAVNALSKSLSELGCEVSLLAMNTHKHFYDGAKLPEALNHYKEVKTVEVDNRIKYGDAFLNLFSKDSYHISRFISEAFKQKLIQLLKREQFDAIQLETLYLAPYIPIIRAHSDAVVSMRAHNVEHEIWERIGQNTKNPLKKWYLKHLTAKLKQFEIDQLNQYDLLIPISKRDLNLFRKLGYENASIVIPIGIEQEAYLSDFESYHRNLEIAFIGSLDWIPNLEGLQWFLDNVWGRLHKKFPDLKLHIAGRNTPKWLMDKNIPNVVVHGEVANAVSFINKYSIMVVPLLSGSGMRAKILEGMALGKVVLTTSLGLEGIPAKNKIEAIVADTPEQFINGIHYCYRKSDKLEQLGQRAQEFVYHYYDSKQIAKRLLKSYSSFMVEVM